MFGPGTTCRCATCITLPANCSWTGGPFAGILLLYSQVVYFTLLTYNTASQLLLHGLVAPLLVSCYSTHRWFISLYLHITLPANCSWTGGPFAGILLLYSQVVYNHGLIWPRWAKDNRHSLELNLLLPFLSLGIGLATTWPSPLAWHRPTLAGYRLHVLLW